MPDAPLTIAALQIAADTPAELCKADRAAQSLSGSSRRRTLGLFDGGCVWLNGQPCHAPWQRLAPGDTLEVRFDPNQHYAPKKKPPKYLGFAILHEDEHVIVVDKPAGWLTVPSSRGERHTLIQRISAYLTKANRKRRSEALAVQRLDGGVSGALVFAKHPAAQRPLRKQFELHEPGREYVALVAGVLAADSGEFRNYLATGKNLTRYITLDPTEGELAITHYQVQQRLPDATLVRIQLETGRRNQIRVHFASIGHPVLGDPRYEQELAKHPRWPHKRLALHAALLEFEHPISGEKLRFEAPTPEEFARFLEGRTA